MKLTEVYQQSSRTRVALTIFFLAALGFLVYHNSFQASFHPDGIRGILENRAVHEFSDLEDLCNDGDRSYLRCVAFVSFALNYQINQDRVFGYHLVNVVIHVLNSILVYFFLRLLFRTPRLARHSLAKKENAIAFFAALIFLTHPVQTQAVTYIWQRFASLATLFYLGALAFYLKARLERKIIYLVLAFLAMVIGMFTKQITATIPITIVVVDFFFLGSRKESGSNRWIYLAPMIAGLLIIPAVVIASDTLSLYSVRHHYVGNLSLGPMDYFWTQLNVMRTYLRLLWLPINLNFDYDYPRAYSFFEKGTLFSSAILIGVLALAIKLFRSRRLISFGIFWFFVTLSVESSFIPLRDVIEEHRLYLPMVGFAIVLSVASHAWFKGRQWIIFASVIVIVLSSLTLQRNPAWRSEKSLWEDVIQKSPDKPRAYNNLAIQHAREGNYRTAIWFYHQAIDKGGDSRSYINLAAAYSETGNQERALPLALESIRRNDRNSKSYYVLGHIYFRMGRLKDAREAYEKVIELDPDNVNIQKVHDQLQRLGVR